jgi:hypothetical protein
MFSRQHFPAPQLIQRAVLGGGHQPGSGVFRNARFEPLLERREQRILGQLLGQPHVAHDASQARDDASRLDVPNRAHGAMDLPSWPWLRA